MRLNRLTDYSVIILSHMACAQRRDREELCSASSIAQDTQVPLPTVSKLLKTLSREKLIQAKRGVAGGYLLAFQAEEITIGQIIKAIEGPIALTACVDESDVSCEAAVYCVLKGHWDVVNQAVSQALESVTLADMAFSFEKAFPLKPLEEPVHK